MSRFTEAIRLAKWRRIRFKWKTSKERGITNLNNLITIAITSVIIISFITVLFLMCAMRVSGELSRKEEQDWESKEYKN